ncbi:MAG: hypothetical protein IOD12_05700 [Silvanigrellales bacterium]|nr:hypothetical protein [Silvanigrellales bacterium]
MRMIGLVIASVLGAGVSGCKPRTFNQVKSAPEGSSAAPSAAEVGVECTPKGMNAKMWNGALPRIRDLSVYFTNHSGGSKITDKTSKGLPVTSNGLNVTRWQQETFFVTKIRCSEALREAFIGPVYVRTKAYPMGENRFALLLAAHGAPPVGEVVTPWTEARKAEWATTLRDSKGQILTGHTRAVVATATLHPGGVLLLQSVHSWKGQSVAFKPYFTTEWVEASGFNTISAKLAESASEDDKAVAEAFKKNPQDLSAPVKASIENAIAQASTAGEALTFSDPRRKLFHEKAFEFFRSYAPTLEPVGTRSQPNALYFHKAASVDKARQGAVFSGQDVWLVSTSQLNVNGGGRLFVLSEGYKVDGVSRPAFVDLTSGTDAAPGAFDVELFSVDEASLNESGQLTVGNVDTEKKWRLSIPGGGANSLVSGYTQPALVER